MKFSNKILLILITFLLNSNLSYASSINDIVVVDDSNITFDVSKDVDLSESSMDAEIKIMKDLNISFISKDFEDKNKLILNLSDDLKENSLYSLITILWPDWNMDFETWLWLEEKEISNDENFEATEQWINRLLILNSRTIELYFNNIIEETELEFKLFNEIQINEISIESSNTIKVSLLDKLDKLSNYILMILSINDSYGNYISLDEDLYEITTTKNLKEYSEESEDENNEVSEMLEEVFNDNIEEGTIEDVALNSAETPDTWPETTILIMLTFILNTIFIFRKKFIKTK